MPIFNDLKKIFFGAKSVAKHQGSKAADAAREGVDQFKESSDELIDLTKQAASEAMEKAPEYLEKGKEALEGLTDKIFREADFGKDKAKDLMDENLAMGDLQPTPEAAAPKSGSIDFESDGLVLDDQQPSAFRESADSALDSAAKAGLAAKDKAEELAEKASELGNDLLGKASTVGASLKEKADDLLNFANEEAEKMKLEDSIEEAKAAAAQAEARARAFDGKEAARDASESTLDGTDSFFDRADRFAKGDYTNEGGKDMRIQQDPDHQPTKKDGGIIAGFLDSDGDGDSLIDDAEIVEEE